MNDTCPITETRPRGLTDRGAKPVWDEAPTCCLETPSPSPVLRILTRARASASRPLVHSLPDGRMAVPQRGPGGVHTPAAAAAALHVPVIDGGGDIPVAEAPPFQRVFVTAVEGDIAPWRHLLCEQN